MRLRPLRRALTNMVQRLTKLHHTFFDFSSVVREIFLHIVLTPRTKLIQKIIVVATATAL